MALFRTGARVRTYPSSRSKFRLSYCMNFGSSKDNTPAPTTQKTPPLTTEACKPNKRAAKPASALPRYGPLK